MRHRTSHTAFNQLPNVSSYSMWPSSRLRIQRPDLQVLDIDEAALVMRAPTGDYRWHDMTEPDFGRYRQRLAYAIHAWMAEVEAADGGAVAALVAHDALLSSIVLADVVRRRVMEGRDPSPILCFADSPSIRLFGLEQEGLQTADYPFRFLPMVNDLGIFGPTYATPFGVALCATSSAADYVAMRALFPQLPAESVVVSRGYGSSTFAPKAGRYADRAAHLAAFVTAPSIDGHRPSEPVIRPTGFDGVVVSGCESASTNRLDALLRAAAHYEQGAAAVATLILGAEDHADRGALESLAWDHLGLRNVFFVSRLGDDGVAAIFDCADVGVFPGEADVGDQLLLECLGCATPVIAVESGCGDDLVSDAVGALVTASDDSAHLAISLGTAIAESINNRWKDSKGPVAAEWVAANFDARNQAASLLALLDEHVVGQGEFRRAAGPAIASAYV